ncbi:MAG: class I SAM-dependent methyltransferase [Saccharofermentanales bacterium]|jgi:O-methyltransferase involved in polyketide biosynthesis
MKYPIEKNTVQETLIIPLYARRLCSEHFPQLFTDQTSAELMDKIDYDFSDREKHADSTMYVFGALEVAMRQNDLAWEVRDYLKTHPRAAVVNLGCGLDNTGRICDNGMCRIYNLDLPDVIALRNKLLPAGEREQNIAADLNNPAWMDDIDGREGAVFFAAGVFYYFTREEARTLFVTMAERFPGGRLVFDSCGPLGVKIMLKAWVKEAGIHDVGAYLSVRDAASLEAWSPRIRASDRGYMLGYRKLGRDIKASYRLLAWMGDHLFGMKIVRLAFVTDHP